MDLEVSELVALDGTSASRLAPEQAATLAPAAVTPAIRRRCRREVVRGVVIQLSRYLLTRLSPEPLLYAQLGAKMPVAAQ